MLDTAYIQELSEMTKKRDAKDALFDYASKTFNITLKKNLQFEEMVEELKTQLEALASEPMPEDNEGLSINDLISATDAVEDTQIFANEEPVKESAIELVSTALGDPQIITLESTSTEEPKTITLEFRPEPIVEEVEVELTYTAPKAHQVAHIPLDEPVEVKAFELPENYSPSLHLIGSVYNCYATLPWWIYEWIEKTPDWKENPHSFPHHYGVDTLLSLIYYIKRDGFVRIRETKNSRFYTLE